MELNFFKYLSYKRLEHQSICRDKYQSKGFKWFRLISAPKEFVEKKIICLKPSGIVQKELPQSSNRNHVRRSLLLGCFIEWLVAEVSV